MLREVIQDVTALGGIPLILVSAALLGLLGHEQAMLQLIAAIALCYAIALSIRTAYFRRRPDKQMYSNWLQRLDAASFPSLHSMRAAAVAWVLYRFFGTDVIGITVALLALTVAVTRVWLKRHHMSDVIVGLLLGLIAGYAATALV